MSNIDTNQVSKILKLRKQILSDLESFEKKYHQAIEEVKKSFLEVNEEGFSKVLKEVSVDEINFDKSGIRIKALNDHGIKTLYDLNKTDLEEIESINGIGYSGALHIKENEKTIINQYRKKYQYHISSDNKTKASTQFIYNVLLLSDIKDVYEQSIDLIKQLNHSSFDNIKKASNSFSWFFLSNSEKKKAEDSYPKAKEIISSIYQEYKSIKEDYHINLDEDKEKTWDKYVSRAAKYNGVIEEALLSDEKGRFFKNNDKYGLSDDLASKIENQQLNLTGLNCKLRYYQVWGVKYAIHQKKALLGDEMGLGKTVQAIACMIHLSNNNEKHFLVVCPASVLINWSREIKQHSILNSYILHGDHFENEYEKWMKDGGVGITTYETTSKLLEVLQDEIGMLVVDEAHYIKNPEASRSKNVSMISKKCKNILFMTGTPIENKTEEMCNLVKMLDSNISSNLKLNASLGQFDTFKKNSELVYYRRKREDVLKELPELINNEDWCTMTKEDKEYYKSALKDGGYAKVRRVSWVFDDPLKSSKATRLKEIIEEAIEEDRKIIVFSFFLDTITTIKNMLGDICSEPITGSIPVNKRQAIIDEFSNNPDRKVLVAQIIAGGTGLNIQSASVIVLCEPQFKPSIENQAISRAYRMGQTRNVVVHRLLCDNTADEKIMDILKSKQAIFDKYADESKLALEHLEIGEDTFKDIIQEERIKYNVE